MKSMNGGFGTGMPATETTRQLPKTFKKQNNYLVSTHFSFAFAATAVSKRWTHLKKKYHEKKSQAYPKGTGSANGKSLKPADVELLSSLSFLRSTVRT